MADINSSLEIKQLVKAEKEQINSHAFIDTHTHFDAPVFDIDRAQQVQQAYKKGVRHLVLVGYLYQYFERMYDTKQAISQLFSTEFGGQDNDNAHLHTHIALGLHPLYIDQHTEEHLTQLEQLIVERRPLAIGEIGLDTFNHEMKSPDIFAKQKRFFEAQLDLAVRHQLPVMLHIRKAHAEALAILKANVYDAHKLGGIAHSFSGGIQEAKAFVKLGFKLGVTGQITNPNAKKLRRAIVAAVDSYGIECLVIETDCPDMTPIMCQTIDHAHDLSERSSGAKSDNGAIHDRNVPANLPWVLSSLSELLGISHARLVRQLWQNSCDALKVEWSYPINSPE
ncbi:TatD family hydrolase [Psychrobacter sp. NG254]|uniref:TatD family hydrolase n=1 Tax=Psychrobacter sp. NG254 TaxID=2782003 RepID=UPI0018871C6C|nr:TatD family hydrolase [Psychrobacter sp. NG254]MBF2720333.1 TatD family hydrolase [Psychrobacter sp. NG254]